SQWSDRKKIVDKILFPGYVFCRLDTLNRLPALSVPGVLGIVGFAEVPTPIPDIEMERVALTIQSGLAVIPWPHISTGDWILVEKGPLAGVEGILVRVKGAHRIVVSFNLLQRSVSAEVDREWIRPIKNIKSATL
ncbi:MAG TPA: transcription termination/antitermination NusG family protein, partial [Bryobacteraceae bacterium]|nr:transcription termination/antitermination NusG family protein [Bryobacteraceae bacterium]